MNAYIVLNDFVSGQIKKRKGARGGNPKAPESTQRPLVLAGSAGKRKDGQ